MKRELPPSIYLEGYLVAVLSDWRQIEGRMYTCKDSVGLLLAFLEGEMAPEDEAQFREHLSACPPCVDFLRTYKATPGLCRRALSKAMPQELADNLKTFLRSKCRK